MSCFVNISLRAFALNGWPLKKVSKEARRRPSGTCPGKDKDENTEIIDFCFPIVADQWFYDTKQHILVGESGHRPVC